MTKPCRVGSAHQCLEPRPYFIVRFRTTAATPHDRPGAARCGDLAVASVALLPREEPIAAESHGDDEGQHPSSREAVDCGQIGGGRSVPVLHEMPE
jgi:hypothetical protein